MEAPTTMIIDAVPWILPKCLAKKSGPKERKISHRHPIVDAENRRIHHPAVDPLDKRHRQKGSRHHQQTAGKHQV